MLLYLMAMFTAALLGGVAFLIGYGVYTILQEYRRDRVPALVYHRFLPKAKVDTGEIIDHEPTYVSYDTAFAEQMAYLDREGYTTISLGEFVAFQDGEASLPPKPIILTFDDGFMSIYRYAFPVLKQYGMKATVFATPDPASENFTKQAGVDAPLTPEQMREMSDYGIAIESHGMTHRYLTEMPPELARWELEESKKVLERIVGKPVQFLCIPSGAYNRTVRRLAKEAGYKAVFGMMKGSNHARSDRYALRRMVIARDFTLADFHAVLHPAATCYLRLISFLQQALLSLLGPRRLDVFRHRLFRMKLARLLIHGQLRSSAGRSAPLMCLALSLGMALFGYGVG
ncbi:MAG TPA: polysaccharide deacetylase family protein [Alphaproteobacteria bacterium]|nr:polysaccharide deacetylase family protein [Alphaproteobacteria bacterium]